MCGHRYIHTHMHIFRYQRYGILKNFLLSFFFLIILEGYLNLVNFLYIYFLIALTRRILSTSAIFMDISGSLSKF